MRVTESMGPAWETMKRMLLRPFNLGTWFSFGFIFFLQSCTEGSGNGFNVPSLPDTSGAHGGSDSTSDHFGAFLEQLRSALGSVGHASTATAPDFSPEIIGVIAIVAVCLAIPLLLLAMWLGTRGQMMAIHSVALERADVGEAWNATRDPGIALFKFDLALMAIGFLVLIPVLGGGAALAYPAIVRHESIASAVPALIALGVLLVIAMIPLIIVRSMARNFVAPIMLKHRVGAREGWRQFWSVARDHVGDIVVFFLLRIVTGIAAWIVGLLASIFTCCLGFLPVIHQTIMAPWYVFERAWTLEVLASLGPAFDLRGGGAPPPPSYGAPAPYTPYGGDPMNNPYAGPGYGGGYGGPPPPPGPGGYGR